MEPDLAHNLTPENQEFLLKNSRGVRLEPERIVQLYAEKGVALPQNVATLLSRFGGFIDAKLHPGDDRELVYRSLDFTRLLPRHNDAFPSMVSALLDKEVYLIGEAEDGSVDIFVSADGNFFEYVGGFNAPILLSCGRGLQEYMECWSGSRECVRIL